MNENAVEYKIGDIVSVYISPDSTDKYKQKFTYEIYYSQPQYSLSTGLEHKIVTLIYLFSKENKPIPARDISDLVHINFSYDITEGAINKAFRNLKEPWDEIVSHPESRATGWIINNLSTYKTLPPSNDYDSYKDDIQKKLVKPQDYKQCKYMLSKADIESAGRLWFQESKKPGNRFSTLYFDFCPDILPLVDIENSNREHKISLRDIIENSSDHLFIIGEGGIGKTTSLYSIMNRAYVDSDNIKNDQIPLYVELSQAFDKNDFELDDHSSKFILNEIERQLKSALKTEIKTEQEIVDLFTQKRNANPEFILLLDGLNEISREKRGGVPIMRMVVAEICKIMNNWHNTRVILTSRSSDSTLSNCSTLLKLSGIEQQQIEDYLINNNIDNCKIDRAVNNRRLMNTLSIPLFLYLYAKIKGEEEPQSKGEILYIFYTQNREVYSERFRNAEINASLKKQGFAIPDNNSLAPQVIYFVIDFVIPEIAWYMVNNNEFEITRSELFSCVTRLFQDKSDTSCLGQYGVRCFEDYLITFGKDTQEIADAIADCFRIINNINYKELSNMICECITIQLGVFSTQNNKEYKIHQHIRDYFAAIYHINKLKLATYIFEKEDDIKAVNNCLEEWKTDPLPTQIQIYIGESLGETQNAPRFDYSKNAWTKPLLETSDSRRTLIKRSLDIFRDYTGRFKNQTDYCVWNLFQILKLTRKDLSGEDFSYLDLSFCHANGYRLGNKSFAADLEGAKINNEFFMPIGHSSFINSVQYSPKTGNYILTTPGASNNAIIWDAKTLEPIDTLNGKNGNISCAQYSPKENYIAAGCSDGTLIIWNRNVKNHNPIEVKEHAKTISSVSFSPDEKRIVTTSYDGTVIVWNTENGDIIRRLSNIPGIFELRGVEFAQFSPDGKYLVTDSFCKALVLETQNYSLVKTLDAHTAPINSVRFSKKGKYLATFSEDKTAILWNSSDGSFDKIENPIIDSAEIFSGCFSPSEDYLITISFSDIKIWDLTSFELVKTLFSNNDSTLISADFSPNGKYIITAGGTSYTLWSSDTYEDIVNIQAGYSNEIGLTQTNSSLNLVLTASTDGIIYIWDSNSFICLGIIKNNFERLKSIQFCHDSKYILTTNWYGNTNIHHSDSYELVENTNVPIEKKSEFVEVSPNGKLIAIKCADEDVLILNDTLEFVCVLYNSRHLDYIIWSPNSDYIIGSYEAFLYIWNSQTGKRVNALKKSSQYIHSIEWSPSTKYILVNYYYKESAVFDANDLTHLKSLKGYSTWIDSTNCKNQNDCLINYQDIKSILLDVPKFNHIGTLMAHTTDLFPLPGSYNNSTGDLIEFPSIIFTAVLSPDGKHLICIDKYHKAYVFETNSFSCILNLSDGFTQKIEFAEYCMNGLYLLLSASDKIYIFNESFSKVRTINSSCFYNGMSPHKPYSIIDNYIITSSHYRSTDVFDLKSLDYIHQFRILPGIDANNLDLSTISNQSKLSNIMISRLKEYGCIFGENESSTCEMHYETQDDNSRSN